MQAITKVFSDIVKPYIDATDNGLIDNDFTNGAVNLLPLITYTNRQFGDATNGYITVNSNADGSFTLNGSRISTASVLLIPIIKDGKYLLTNNILKKGKSYKYSCCPPNSVSQHLLSQINYRDGSNNLVQFEEGGAGVTINIPIDATAGNCNIAVYHDADFTDVIIKPMITLADMPNSDYAHYVPYAMSNQELTSENQTLKNQIAQSSDEYSSSRAYKVGELCIYNNTLYKCITACSAAAWSVNQSCFTEDTLTNVLSEINLDIELISTKTALTTAGVIINIPNLDNYKEIYFYSVADDNDMSFGQTIIPTKLAKTFKYGFMSASSASGNYSFFTTIQYRGNNNFLIGYSALQGFSTPYIVIYGIH